MQKTYVHFLEDLAARESGGRYKNVNPLGYLGKYQMGEPALIDSGYYRPDGKTTDNHFSNAFWTGQDGIHSKTDFLNNPQAQEHAIRIYMGIQWKYIVSGNLDRFVGQIKKGILLTVSGLLGGAHLGGTTRLTLFLKQGIIKTDKNGVPVTQYIQKFAGYETPFQPRKKLTGIKKDQHGKTVMYQINGQDWVPKAAAIQMVKDDELDAVIVKDKVGAVFLRTPPDHSLSNNLLA